MSTFSKVSLVTVVIAGLVLVGVGTAFAQSETPPPPFERGPLGPGYGHGPGGHMDGVLAEYADIRHEALGEALGISSTAFEEARESGETLHSLAAEYDVEMADLWAAMADAREEMLEAAVSDGVLTAEQAEWMQSRPGGPIAGRHGGTGPCHGDGFDGPGRMGGGGRGR